MSTPKKEESNETSDPVFLNSGEVSQEVVEEKKEITLQDVLNQLGGIEERIVGRIGGKVDNLMVRMEVMENRMAVQEARMTPPRSRAPSQESVKELKTAASVVEVTERTSLLVDFVSSEDSASEDSAGVQVHLPLKMPGQPQYFAQSLDVHDTNLFPSETLDIADDRSEGNKLVVGDFVADRVGRQLGLELGKESTELAGEDELFHGVTQDARRPHSQGLLTRAEPNCDKLGEQSLTVRPKRLVSEAEPWSDRHVSHAIAYVGNALNGVVDWPELLVDTREDSVQAHSLDVHEGNDDPALMKKPEPPDIKKVMERRLGQQETKSPPRRLVRRESFRGKGGRERSSVEVRYLSTLST